MTRDEIIDKDEVLKMARQSGFLYGKMGPLDMPFVTAIGHTFTVELEIFAKLVADVATAKEREACAKVCEDREEQWRKAGFFKDVHEFREMAFYIRARGEA